MMNQATRTASPGTPASLDGQPSLATAAPGPLDIDEGGQHWTGWVDVRPNRRVVAIYDFTRHTAEERRLLISATVAGVVGVLLAALLGLVFGRRAVQPLGRALRLQRRFVADASHELRTPLTVLATRAQLLQRHLNSRHANSGSADNHYVAEELAQLVGDARALGEVITDLLVSAQLQHTDIAGEEVDTAALTRAVVASMQAHATTAGVTLVNTTHPDETTPATDTVRADPSLHVIGAPTALRRAVVALVDNAIAHSDPGGIVKVSTRRVGDEVLLSVRDTGEGLDPADRDQLTQRFARGHSSTHTGRRFGLGLALVDEIVRAHSGRLDIDGRPGEGSIFTVALWASTAAAQTSSR